MNIVKTKRLLNPQFYPEVKEKSMVFLHHTAGTTADGAISWWNQTPEKVGTAYVVERDGTIYEVFDPAKWGYHLGVKGDDDFIEKNSIGIEIVAAGILFKEPDGFYSYPLYPNKVKKIKIPDTDVWDMGDKGWRGTRYFHAYSDAQVTAVIDLVNQLVSDFKIEVDPSWKNSKFYEFNADIAAKHLPGIWSHTSVRKDKNDIVPYQPFLKKLFEGIKVSAKKK